MFFVWKHTRSGAGASLGKAATERGTPCAGDGFRRQSARLGGGAPRSSDFQPLHLFRPLSKLLRRFIKTRRRSARLRRVLCFRHVTKTSPRPWRAWLQHSCGSLMIAFGRKIFLHFRPWTSCRPQFRRITLAGFSWFHDGWSPFRP